MFVHKISQHTKYLKILSEIKLREGHQLITALLFLTLQSFKTEQNTQNTRKSYSQKEKSLKHNQTHWTHTARAGTHQISSETHKTQEHLQLKHHQTEKTQNTSNTRNTSRQSRQTVAHGNTLNTVSTVEHMQNLSDTYKHRGYGPHKRSQFFGRVQYLTQVLTEVELRLINKPEVPCSSLVL